MIQNSKITADMYTAASQSDLATYGYIFMVTDQGVTCYAPATRIEEARDFIQRMKAIKVTGVNHVDWEISKANIPQTSNKNVLALQAALDAAKLSKQVLVFANDGIKVNTNGPTFEVHLALFLLRTANIPVYENGFFTHGM
ncbi:MAG: hypothetical protein K2Y22_15105 [Candidatus Obscuribacterales bacterium]|nr:hypothetical protein [Candidatus Obscuribacterales bacterium]